jgi:hypothetical protein
MDGSGWVVSDFVDVVWRVVQVYGITLVFVRVILWVRFGGFLTDGRFSLFCVRVCRDRFDE